MEGQTLKQALKKGKAKICSTEKCNQISRKYCEKCQKPSCNFHMCKRLKTKILICDGCHYAEIKNQIEIENQKDKKTYQEKLVIINEKNNECYKEAKSEEKVIEELEAKIKNLHNEFSVKFENKIEEIKKEQYLKESNLQKLANLKAAMENSSEINNAENEKLVKVKNDVSTLQIDIIQINDSIKELQSSIKNSRDQLDNSISCEKMNETMCPKCIARTRGISFIKTMSIIEGKGSNKACTRCLIF